MYTSTPADLPDPPFRFFEGLVPRLKKESDDRFAYTCGMHIEVTGKMMSEADRT